MNVKGDHLINQLLNISQNLFLLGKIICTLSTFSLILHSGREALKYEVHSIGSKSKDEGRWQRSPWLQVFLTSFSLHWPPASSIRTVQQFRNDTLLLDSSHSHSDKQASEEYLQTVMTTSAKTTEHQQNSFLLYKTTSHWYAPFLFHYLQLL